MSLVCNLCGGPLVVTGGFEDDVRLLRTLASSLERSLERQGPSPSWDFPAEEMADKARLVVLLRALAGGQP